MTDIFLKVVNMSISAGWMVLAVVILRLLLKKAPKFLSVLLWAVVAVRLVCPFSLESGVSLVPSSETVAPGIMYDDLPAIDSGIDAVDNIVNPIVSGSFAPNPGDSANPLQILIPLLSAVWVAGTVLMLVYTAVSCLRVKRSTGTAVLLRDNIYRSDNLSSPFVFGIIRPRIYLPVNIDGGDMEHVIAHEKAHIRRKDHLWKPLGFLILAVHWFNPLIWLAYALLCRDIELACDEKVVKELNSRQKADYSQALLTCSVNRRGIAACPLAFGEIGVKGRVKQVLSYKKPTFWLIAAAVIVCVIFAVCFLTDPKSDTVPPDAPVMIVVSNEQSIEVKAGEAYPDRVRKLNVKIGESKGVALPKIDIVPAYFSNLDPLSALISFNIESGDPTRTTTPDEMYVVCWPNGYRPSNEDGQDESVPVKVVNGNMYITLFDSSCVYEVVATWNGSDGRNDTLRYTFYAYKNSMNFSFSAAAVIEIIALGKGGFCQITDDDVIAKIVDKINYAKFYPGKIGEFEDNAYEMKFYDRHAQLIDKIIMMSDREILYGEDTVNYITAPKYSLGYDYIDRLYKQANPQ
ncbi:MAG: peptidase M56 [Clostridia bacterium]|nr:peptidase M56 [Clostridia bacterium]